MGAAQCAGQRDLPHRGHDADGPVEVWGKPEKGDPFRNATPARRFAEPVEVADAALYLASDASAMVNGALLMVEGGFTSV
jgi:NAD(P)-dependent dehydrogenase (short-subunit alcohol dehydrogenase family)